MKKNLKKTFITLGVVCMLCMTATACGTDSKSGNAAKNPAGSTQTPGTGASSTEASNADTPDAQTTEADDSQRTASSTNNPQTTGTDTKDASSDLDQNNAGIQPEDPESSGRWHVLDSETARLVDADFEGTVQKIGQGTFYVSKNNTEVFDDGSMVSTAVSSDATVEDSDLLQVIYDDSTYFYIRMIYNGGASLVSITCEWRYLPSSGQIPPFTLTSMIPLCGISNQCISMIFQSNALHKLGSVSEPDRCHGTTLPYFSYNSCSFCISSSDTLSCRYS